MDNGNGALMRILPFSLYCVFHRLGPEETAVIAGNGSALTHGHAISRICCFFWTEFLRSVSEGAGMEKAIDHIENLPYSQWFPAEAVEAADFITGRQTRRLTEKDIGQCNITLPYQVPQGKCFVMGDHRSMSVDSRNTAVGCISNDAVIGRLVARVWPLDSIGLIS